VNRREFIGVLGGLTIGRPVVARAQQSELTRRLGVFKGNAYDIPEEQAEYDVFLQRLRKLGWLEGRNISIEYRSLVGGPDDARSFARRLRAPNAAKSRASALPPSARPVAARATSPLPASRRNPLPCGRSSIAPVSCAESRSEHGQSPSVAPLQHYFHLPS
jgi:putative ABC transport system substrate-binding protein